MSRFKTLAAVAVLGAGAAACAPSNQPLSPAYNPSVNSLHQPVVQRTDYVLDLASRGNGLSREELQRLDAWLVSVGARYGDNLYIDEPSGYADVAARNDIARVAADYGLVLADGAPVLNGEVPPGAIRVIASRTTANVPGCPLWAENGANADTADRTSSNYGCAVNSNLAAMIANPEDLLYGQEGTTRDSGNTANTAVGAYRRRVPSGTQPLPSTTTGNQQ